MGNKEWKRGDKVLCVGAVYPSALVNGQEYTIDGFTTCQGCGCPCVYLVGLDETKHMDCPGCFYHKGVREFYARSIFIRPDLSSLTEYRNQVSVREIPSELKELKNLEN